VLAGSVSILASYAPSFSNGVELLFWLGTSPALNLASRHHLPSVLAAVNAAIAKAEQGAAAMAVAMAAASGGSSSTTTATSSAGGPSCRPPHPLPHQWLHQPGSVWAPSTPGGAAAGPGRPPPSPTLDQSRTPFSQRQPVLRTAWLPVAAPFHSPLLAGAVERAVGDCLAAGLGAALCPAAAAVPIHSTLDGSDLTAAGGGGSSPAAFLRTLIALQCVHPVDWVSVVAGWVRGGQGQGQGGPVQAVLDLGPGGAGGGARMAARLLQGSGIPVILGVHWGAEAQETALAVEEAGSTATTPALVSLSTEGHCIYGPQLLALPPPRPGGCPGCCCAQLGSSAHAPRGGSAHAHACHACHPHHSGPGHCLLTTHWAPPSAGGWHDTLHLPLRH
jgi:hypothetical protein